VRSRPEESVRMLLLYTILLCCATLVNHSGGEEKKKVPMSRASKETDLFELRGALLCRPHGAPIPRRGDPYIYCSHLHVYTNIMYVTYLGPPRIYVRHVYVRYMWYSIVCKNSAYNNNNYIIYDNNTYLVYYILFRSIIYLYVRLYVAPVHRIACL